MWAYKEEDRISLTEIEQHPWLLNYQDSSFEEFE